MKNGYDIIGDIHGHARELEVLLQRLGYVERAGAFRHEAGRRVIFLGDYLDRGPAIRRVLEIVRGMVVAGTAHAILGNHEVNALRWHTTDAAGWPLRPHDEEKRAQHAATLAQLAEPAPAEWRTWLAWLSALPLWLDLGELRAVHAAWDEAALARLRGVGPLVGATLERFSRRGTPEFDALSRLINGPEARLADNRLTLVYGQLRHEIRVRWWHGAELGHARDAVFPRLSYLPPLPLLRPSLPGYRADAPPVFFGHYATTPDESVLAPNVACLDLGQGKGGHLAAYRWDGERTLDRKRIIMAPDRYPAAPQRPTPAGQLSCSGRDGKVEARGVEPLSSRTSAQASTGLAR